VNRPSGPSRDHAEDVRGVVAAHLPDYPVESVVRLGEGMDNTAYEVNGELVVRFGKDPDPARRAACIDREARLLAAVAEVSPLPVPEPMFTDAEQGCMAYFTIPGVPLVDVPRPPPARRASIAAALGEFLAALHAVPADRMADMTVADEADVGVQPPGRWLREAADSYAAVADAVPAANRRAAEAFLAAPPPAGDGCTPVFTHNDLGIEHVLVDPDTWAVTGVIDWSDAAFADPAYDVGLLHRDLGPAAAATVAVAVARGLRAAVGDDANSLGERAAFYARCSVFEDLAYGVETGRDEYVGKSLAAMEWLFPAQGKLSA
jgi:aminoglycoside phosphotransferase (APT) family kinase protein